MFNADQHEVISVLGVLYSIGIRGLSEILMER